MNQNLTRSALVPVGPFFLECTDSVTLSQSTIVSPFFSVKKTYKSSIRTELIYGWCSLIQFSH